MCEPVATFVVGRDLAPGAESELLAVVELDARARDSFAGGLGQHPAGEHVPTVECRYIGKRGVTRHDGYVKASGDAIYTRDIVVPGMLYARVKRSPYAHARIVSMDTTRAEALPGVKAILRYDDPEVKGRELNGSVLGPERLAGPIFTGIALKPDRRILPDEAWFEGQIAGAVCVADTEEIADQALSPALKLPTILP